MITKIESLDNGNVMLLDGNDEGVHCFVFGNPLIIQKHARDSDAVLLSDTPTNQDEHEGIKIYASSITSINGEVFSGDRNDLMLELTDVFN